MADESTNDVGGVPKPGKSKPIRTFLVVVDDSEEMRAALRYACLRARKCNGQVALFRAVEPAEFQHFAAIGELMREEAREEAEQLLQKLAADVNRISGHVPSLYVREGDRREELLSLLKEEPGISVLVLAAGTGEEGPGPLVSALTGKMAGRLKIPVTVVPGGLSDEDIERLA